MAQKTEHKKKKELILLIGSLIIVILCIGAAVWLGYQSIKLNNPIPEYYLTIFTSIATLVIGYTLGSNKND